MYQVPAFSIKSISEIPCYTIMSLILMFVMVTKATASIENNIKFPVNSRDDVHSDAIEFSSECTAMVLVALSVMGEGGGNDILGVHIEPILDFFWFTFLYYFISCLFISYKL